MQPNSSAATLNRVTTGGGFTASTHDVADAKFMGGGDMTFRGSSGASGAGAESGE